MDKTHSSWLSLAVTPHPFPSDPESTDLIDKPSLSADLRQSIVARLGEDASADRRLEGLVEQAGSDVPI